MIGRNTRSMLSVLLGLLVVFAANTAAASIICDRQPADELFDAAAALSADQGMTPATEDRPSSPPNDREDPPTVDQLEAFSPANGSAGQPSSVSQGGGSGSSSAAISGAFCDLPQAPLQTALPREARPYLPTGPPFELLRPPRVFIGA